MNTHNTSQHEANANLFGAILMITAVIVIAILALNRDGVSLVVATVPTATPTAMPTEVPTEIPTATPTGVPTEISTEIPTEIPTEAATEETATQADDSAEVVAIPDYAPELVAQGQELYFQCAACHGPDGQGVDGLGKSLVESEFVHSLTDEELLDFVLVGRPIWDPLNTTGIDMPPKGGNPALSNEDILAIIAYIRSLGVVDETNTGTTADSDTETSTSDVATDEQTTSDYAPELVAQGQELYFQCAACHGPDGQGVDGLGKSLVESEFVHSLTDEELLDFVLVGRPIWDPLNTTGIDMPPKGGNPALSNEDILAIIAYIRSLEP